jgi:hypothetical protein
MTSNPVIKFVCALAVILIGCAEHDDARAQPPVSAEDIIHTSEQLVLEFPFDTTDPSAFGLDYTKGPFARGPQAIAIIDDAAFIVDSYHNNVKRIDLLTGELSASAALEGASEIHVDDITAFGGRLYLCGYLDTVHVMSATLEHITSIALDEKYWRNEKFFLRHDTTFVELYCPTDQEVIAIRDNSVSVHTVASRGGVNTLGGNPFLKTRVINGVLCATTQYGNIELKRTPLPRAPYDPFTWAYTGNWFVCFDVDKNQCTVYVLKVQLE